MIFWEKFMYHQNTLKIFSSQYLGMFSVHGVVLPLKENIPTILPLLLLIYHDQGLPQSGVVAHYHNVLPCSMTWLWQQLSRRTKSLTIIICALVITWWNECIMGWTERCTRIIIRHNFCLNYDLGFLSFWICVTGGTLLFFTHLGNNHSLNSDMAAVKITLFCRHININFNSQSSW